MFYKYKYMANYYTEEGLKRLQAELEQLQKIERPSISAQIAEARDKGDLSENAEYDAAKEAQGLLELRISKLKAVIADVRIVDESLLDTSKVLLLSRVTLKNQGNGMTLTYTLVPEKEADIAKKFISVESPIGKGLLGKEKGDIAEIEIPAGLVKFEILEIGR